MFGKLRLLVFGDTILDHYARGEATRLSPEAPVPVLNVLHDDYRLGGAANVAANIASLGATVVYVSVIGIDPAASCINNAVMPGHPRILSHIISDATRRTTVKTRCISHNQQMLRIDHEDTHEVSGTAAMQLASVIGEEAKACHGFVVSDYGKGTVTEQLFAKIVRSAGHKPVFVDPKGNTYAKYHGATVITPNKLEAEHASGYKVVDMASGMKACKSIMQLTGCDTAMVTAGEDGVYLRLADGTENHVRTLPREVFDVTGAGDTFLAAMALAWCSGKDARAAAEIGNAAAGVTVTKAGAVSVSLDELTASFREIDIFLKEHANA